MRLTKYSSVVFVLVFTFFYFNIFASKTFAQSCTGSAISTGPGCATEPFSGKMKCIGTRTVNSSCSWDGTQCSRTAYVINCCDGGGPNGDQCSPCDSVAYTTTSSCSLVSGGGGSGGCSGWCTNAGDSCVAHGLPGGSGSCGNGGQCCGSNSVIDVCSRAVQATGISYSCNSNGTATVSWSIDPGISAGDPPGGWQWSYSGQSGVYPWNVRTANVNAANGGTFDVAGLGTSGTDCSLQHATLNFSCPVVGCWVTLPNSLSSINLTYGSSPITLGIGSQNSPLMGVYQADTSPWGNNNWSTLVYGPYGSGALSWSCPAPGRSYYIVCNSARADNSLFCSGNPWTSSFPSCGSSDRVQINCAAAATPIPPTAVPPTPVPPTPLFADCTVTTSPVTTNLTIGQSTTVTANITTSAVVSSVIFGSYNTGVATVSPTSRANPGPYSTTVTAQAAGGTAVWATVFLTNGNRCDAQGGNDTDVNVISNPPPTATPTPVPCRGSIGAIGYSSSMELGGSQNVTIPTSVLNCASSYVGITTSNFAVPVTNPASIGGGRYQTAITPVDIGTANITVTLYGQSGEFLDSKQITVNVLCTAPPPPTNVQVSDAILKVNISWNPPTGGGTYEGYVVARSGDGFTYNRIAPQFGSLPTSTRSYLDTSMTCGNYYYYAVQTYDSTRNIKCQLSDPDLAFAYGTCVPYQDWFAARAGNVIAGSYLRSSLPPGSPSLPGGLPLARLIDDFPGMAIGGDVSGLTGLSSGAISSKNWLVGTSSVVSKNENTYSSMVERMLTKATPMSFTGDISDGNYLKGLIQSAGSANTIPASGGIVLLRHGGDMTIGNAGGVDIGPRKVILLVDGSVQINNTITMVNPGFFAIFVSGDIRIHPKVGEPTYQDIRPVAGYNTPQLMGVYYAEGTFNTGDVPPTCGTPPCTALQLRIDGSIIGMSGVNMQRSVKGPYPSEYVDFKPEYAYTLHQVGLRRKVFQELLNP